MKRRTLRRFWTILCCTLLLQVCMVSAQTQGLSAIEPSGSFGRSPSLLAQAAAPEPQGFDQLLAGTQRQEGLLTLHRNPDDGTVFLELTQNQLNRNFLAVVTLDSGIGEGYAMRGMPVNDFLMQFRRVNNQIQLVVPNVYFRTTSGDPQRPAVEQAFSDSVLYALPIKAIHP
ncbi:MAG TPA: DUF5118 domain-containing protein, partial [Chroococcidiopsis sp.]